MFTRVKPSIIFSIWPGPVCLLVVCWCIQIAECSSSECETPTGVIRAKAGRPWPSPSFSHRPHVTVSGLRSHLNSRLTGRVMSPFLLYSHVHMSVPTNQRQEYRSRDRPRPIRSQTQSAMTPPMSDPICPDTGTPGHIRSGSQYKCTVHLCLSPANPRVIYGLNHPPDASTGALIFAWFSSSESHRTGIGFRILWP